MDDYHKRKAAEHEDEAERLINTAISWSEETSNLLKDSMIVAVAQVHATLALAHRTARITNVP